MQNVAVTIAGVNFAFIKPNVNISLYDKFRFEPATSGSIVDHVKNGYEVFAMEVVAGKDGNHPEFRVHLGHVKV